MAFQFSKRTLLAARIEHFIHELFVQPSGYIGNPELHKKNAVRRIAFRRAQQHLDNKLGWTELHVNIGMRVDKDKWVQKRRRRYATPLIDIAEARSDFLLRHFPREDKEQIEVLDALRRYRETLESLDEPAST